MSSQSKNYIVRSGNYFPRNNFPLKLSRKRKEANFVISFAKSYKKIVRNKKISVVRELSMNGYGIADLVSLEISMSKKTKLVVSTQIVTFEMKISDWKKAIQQAFRYKYFGNKSIVVLPPEEAKKAQKIILTFKVLNIGLWGYDIQNKKIIKYYTPRLKKPLNMKAKIKAIDLLKKSL